jgi:hypothetical protein
VKPITKVLWIMEENRDYGEVMGSGNAPYLNSLASKYGYVNGTMHAETHPSLGNYIAATSGNDYGIVDDDGPGSHPLNVANVFTQLGANQTSLMDGMPSNCDRNDYDGDGYAVKHNPAAYFTNNSACDSRDQPLPPNGTGDLSKAFTFVVPNLNHDMHDGTVRQGDDWLASYLPNVLASPEYAAGTMAIMITWDEDDSYGPGNVIPTVVVSPRTAHVATTSTYNHYSLLAATQQLLGLPNLGNQAEGVRFNTEFGLR